MSSTTRRDIVSWAQVPGVVDVSMAGIGVYLGVALRIFVGAMAVAAPMQRAWRARGVCMPRVRLRVIAPLHDGVGAKPTRVRRRNNPAATAV